MPKPKGYNRIILPERSYQSLPDTLPYWFEYSTSARLVDDDSWITDRYWIDLIYPYFDADVQITYKSIDEPEQLEEYLNDSYRLTAQHNIKAYAIEESILPLKNGDVASVSELDGEVPSQVQFHVTDSVKHFLRGALYFKVATKNDSLAPSIAFIRDDILHMLRTLEWRD